MHRASRYVSVHSSLLVEAEVLLSRHNAQSVGVTHSSSPALHTDDWGALLKHTKLDGIHDTPGQTTVNVLLPWCGVKVGLLLREVEWIDAAVQV